MFARKHIAVLGLLLLVGCQSSKVDRIPASTDVRGFDFRPYTEQGFLFTPAAYAGLHDAIGLVTLTVWPGAHKEGARTSAGRIERWVADTLDATAVLDAVYEETVAMGADALTHFEIRPVTKSEHGASFTGYEVSGFAIDRLDN